TYYDPVQDRLLLVGGFARDGGLLQEHYGPQVWSTPLGSELHWTQLNSTAGVLPPGPPDAHTAFAAAGGPLLLAADSTVWTRRVDDTGPWTPLDVAGDRPTVSSAIAYDATRDQLLALFASERGSDDVQAWALATGPLTVTPAGASRSAGAIDLRWR